MTHIIDWFFLFFFIFGLIAGMALIAFSRLTMARIERDMKAAGLPDTFLWDGTGGRVVFYAFAIALPEKIAQRIDRRLIDAPLVRRYASRADRLRGLSVIWSFSIWIIVTFAGIWVVD